MAITVTGRQVIYEPEEKYVITLDADGGKIGSSNIVTKEVVYGENYGDLPVPVREGYTFAGWSRNLADEISEQNYSFYNYHYRTSNEIKNDGNFAELTNQKYIRINGYQNENNVDTSWRIEEVSEFKVSEGKKYILSFYVRSQNAITTQFFYNYGNGTDGKTFIEWSDGTSTYLINRIYFANDGQWHLITEEFTVPQGVTTAQISIGNDFPNIYGIGSYIDIANIQFAEDASITPYYIQSSTQVVTQNNHTLIAKWVEEP